MRGVFGELATLLRLVSFHLFNAKFTYLIIGFIIALMYYDW